MRFLVSTSLAIVFSASIAHAQDPVASAMPGHQHHTATPAEPESPLGISHLRDGSGTSWLPDTSPMLGLMAERGPWTLMLHGNTFLQAIGTRGERGDRQVGSINWIMPMATRRVGGGPLELRGMFSVEPLTVGRCGYPTLLGSGESCRGEALHDRQHPHDLLMELAARYRRAIASGLAIELYGGPAGEPALGPTAFPHRLSAMPNPIAPVAHHWLDSTHISFGVVTAGVYGHRWKAEGSAFNGREPDDERYDIDGGALDSYAARVWLMPTPRLVLQVSAGHLTDAEEHEDGTREDVRRITASATWHTVKNGNTWAWTAAWGRNRERHHSTSAVLGEAALDLTAADTLFLRGEIVQKSADELVLPLDAHDPFTLTKMQTGYTRWVHEGRGLKVGLGVSGAVSLLPAPLEPFYGSRRAAEGAVFLTVRPQGHGMAMP